MSSTSRLITDCDTELRTSTIGEAPETVTVSSSVPTASSAVTVAVNDADSRMPSRRTVRKPVSMNVTT